MKHKFGIAVESVSAAKVCRGVEKNKHFIFIPLLSIRDAVYITTPLLIHNYMPPAHTTRIKLEHTMRVRMRWYIKYKMKIHARAVPCKKDCVKSHGKECEGEWITSNVFSRTHTHTHIRNNNIYVRKGFIEYIARGRPRTLHERTRAESAGAF